MNRFPLPVVDGERTEFGFARTSCACPACALHCQHLPGYLIPADVERIHAFHRPDLDLQAWAYRYLRASPGALVAKNGRAFRIPTLVPARRPDGACIFLTETGACSIHPVSPFACAFFDSHMSGALADRRSFRGLNAIADAWRHEEDYAALWCLLHESGCTALAPEQARSLMASSQEPALPTAAGQTHLTDRELATVLAALRYWQQSRTHNATPVLSEHFDESNTPLTIEEIDALCEQLNCLA